MVRRSEDDDDMFVLGDSNNSGAVFALNTSTTAGRRDSSGNAINTIVRPSSIVMLPGGNANGDGDDESERQSWWENPNATQWTSCAQMMQLCIHALVLAAVPVAFVLAAHLSNNRALPYMYSFFVALASFEYAWLAYRVRLRVFLPFKLHQKQTCRDIYSQIMSYSVDLETCAVTPLAERFLRGRRVLTASLLGMACSGITVAMCMIPGLESSPMAYCAMSVFLAVFCASLAPSLPDALALLLRYGFYFVASLNVVMTLGNKAHKLQEERGGSVMHEPLTLEPFSLVLVTAALLLICRVLTSKEPIESAVMVLLDVTGLLYISCAAIVLDHFSRSAATGDHNSSSSDVLIAFFVIVWSSELGSFLMERLLKFVVFPWNHPLAKRVSSRQNVEKLVGALAGGICATFLVSGYVDFQLEPALVACLTAGAVLLSQVCKLFLLSLKKVAKIPATGEYLAVGGGVLDRMDTILFMAVVFSPLFEHQVSSA